MYLVKGSSGTGSFASDKPSGPRDPGREGGHKTRYGGDHRGNGGRATFELSTQDAPAARRRSKTGTNLLLHVTISAEKQFEQAALHPEFQMLAILSAGPIANLRHRGCRSSAILFKHVEQGLRL